VPNQKSAAPNQGAYEPPTDPREVEEEKFAKMLGEELNKLDSKTIRKLIIFAPAAFQHRIKNHLEKSVLKKANDFYDKNYLNLSIKDLEKHLANTLDLKF